MIAVDKNILAEMRIRSRRFADWLSPSTVGLSLLSIIINR